MLMKYGICVGLVVVLIVGCERTTVRGPNAEKITLTKPADTSIIRGDTAKVEIVVKRENINQPVTIEFTQLPAGVTVVNNDAKMEGATQTFVLAASSTAGLVDNHRAIVSVHGPGGLTAKEEFAITVRDKS